VAKEAPPNKKNWRTNWVILILTFLGPLSVIRQSIGIKLNNFKIKYGSGKSQVENLVSLEIGRFYNAGPLITLDYFANSLEEITETDRPILAYISSPFKGRLAGVYIRDSPDSAAIHARKYFPHARSIDLSHYQTPEEFGWHISLNDSLNLFLSIKPKYKKGKPVKVKFDSTLFFYNKQYRIINKKYDFPR
jgi:hypothetical protein